MMNTTTLVRRAMRSPLGELCLVADELVLRGVYFPEHRQPPPPARLEAGAHALLDRAEGELAEYFAGRRRTFSTPCAPMSGTPFQRAVWAELGRIPFGERLSYGELARRLDRPRAARAVGAANGMNPLSIFVPCHRVGGGDGSLTGYAGGLEAKRWLLEHERSCLTEVQREAGPPLTPTASPRTPRCW